MKRLLAVSIGCGAVGIALLACTAFSGSSDTPPGDEAGNDADATLGMTDGGTDAKIDGDAAAPCKGAFGPLTLQLQSNGTFYIDSVTLTNDERDAYVTLFRAGGFTETRTVYAMHRGDPTKAFTLDPSQPQDLGDSGPTPGAFDVGLSPDDATLYFSHRQDPDAGVLAVDIYKVNRTANGTLANEAKLESTINVPGTDQFHAHRAGARLYFTVAPVVAGAQGQRDLYVALLDGLTARVRMDVLSDSTHQDENPVPSRDELEIFFASDRSSVGVDHVYVSSRGTTVDAFGAPTPVEFPAQDASAALDPQYLSGDRCRLYVLVDRKDLYVSVRARE